MGMPEDLIHLKLLSFWKTHRRVGAETMGQERAKHKTGWELTTCDPIAPAANLSKPQTTKSGNPVWKVATLRAGWTGWRQEGQEVGAPASYSSAEGTW